MQELLGQMSRIQEKASESEAIVKNITKDIQILDLAKKNLMLSITSLQQLQSLGVCVLSAEHLLCELMPLVNEIAQLESLIRENKYHDIVHVYGVCFETCRFDWGLGFNLLTQFSRRSNSCP